MEIIDASTASATIWDTGILSGKQNTVYGTITGSSGNYPFIELQNRLGSGVTVCLRYLTVFSSSATILHLELESLLPDASLTRGLQTANLMSGAAVYANVGTTVSGVGAQPIASINVPATTFVQVELPILAFGQGIGFSVSSNLDINGISASFLYIAL